MMKTQPTSEEKLWAIVSHLSSLISGTGMLLSSFTWLEHHKRSRYVAFHALQAFAYQSLGYTLWSLVAAFVLMAITIATLPQLSKIAQDPAEMRLWILTHALVGFVLYIFFLLSPIMGAVMCALGRDFRYPLIGNRLARYIGYDPAAGDGDPAPSDANEERVAASMGHFAIIYPLWGMFPSVVFLATGKARSPFLRFQSVQTVVFQAISTLMTIGLGVLAFAILLGAIVPFVTNPSVVGGPPMESLLAALLFLICLMVILLIVPFFQIIGQWAGMRILQGHDYRYPLVGRWAEKRLAKREKL